MAGKSKKKSSRHSGRSSRHQSAGSSNPPSGGYGDQYDPYGAPNQSPSPLSRTGSDLSFISKGEVTDDQSNHDVISYSSGSEADDVGAAAGAEHDSTSYYNPSAYDGQYVGLPVAQHAVSAHHEGNWDQSYDYHPDHQQAPGQSRKEVITGVTYVVGYTDRNGDNSASSSMVVEPPTTYAPPSTTEGTVRANNGPAPAVDADQQVDNMDVDQGQDQPVYTSYDLSQSQELAGVGAREDMTVGISQPHRTIPGAPWSSTSDPLAPRGVTSEGWQPFNGSTHPYQDHVSDSDMYSNHGSASSEPDPEQLDDAQAPWQNYRDDTQGNDPWQGDTHHGHSAWQEVQYANHGQGAWHGHSDWNYGESYGGSSARGHS
ncbi:hypothetical protein VTJ49DRAFT_5981 [Mycothermus thermophilus]|uniref:Uncharacterized protein n=1 Tax=Humicola insolens TaxID=85995 RepID=A0ABR3V245_HUMIN